ncbi:MAG: cation:proton antiporter [Chloroflexota bacterium]|nr:cation:proton antiporter [Chloroflexota bacterium]
MEDFTLLKDFAIIMAVAGAVTLLFRKLNQPPILGYLIAGLLVGPYSVLSSPISDVETIRLLADLGLVMLLFGLGLEFSWSIIRQVGLSVLIIGTLEILTLLCLGYGLGRVMGWDPIDSVFLGAALHISSSAIIIKVLKDSGRLGLHSSKLIVGILVVEDFAAVAIIAILSGIGSTDTTEFGNIWFLILRLMAFIVASLVFGAVLIPRIIDFTRQFNSREALLITSLGLCFMMALLGTALGLSPAIGAFLVGTIIADTKHSNDVNEVVIPIRDMFAAIFFVSIGMLIDSRRVIEFIIPGLVIAITFIGGKIVANTVAALATGNDPRTSLEVGTGMPQMGEFSLAIAKVGADQGHVSAPLYPSIALATAFSSFTAPYIARSTDRIAEILNRRTPKPLKEYIFSLADWFRALQISFSRDNESARKIQHYLNVTMINLSIVLVLVAAGSLVLEFADDLSEFINVRPDTVGLMLGFLILFLCLPGIIGVWRNLKGLVDEGTNYVISRQSSPGIWGHERIRNLLRDSIVIVLCLFATMWLIPFVSQLISTGPYSAIIPLLLLIIMVYLVSISIRHIHTQIVKTFSRTLLGQEYLSVAEVAIMLDLTHTDVEKLIHNMGIAAIEGEEGWRIDRASVEEYTEKRKPIYDLPVDTEETPSTPMDIMLSGDTSIERKDE